VTSAEALAELDGESDPYVRKLLAALKPPPSH